MLFYLIIIYILILIYYLIDNGKKKLENFSTKIYKFIIINEKNNKEYELIKYDKSISNIFIKKISDNLNNFLCTFNNNSIKINYRNDSIINFNYNKLNIKVENRNRNKKIKIIIENDGEYSIYYFYKDYSNYNNENNFFISDNYGNDYGYIQNKNNKYIIIVDNELYKYIDIFSISFIFYLNDQ